MNSKIWFEGRENECDYWIREKISRLSELWDGNDRIKDFKERMKIKCIGSSWVVIEYWN